MNPMQLAQMKRTLEWATVQLHHKEQEYKSAELAFTNAKKHLEELKKKIEDDKRSLETMKRTVAQADDEVRKQQFKDRR